MSENHNGRGSYPGGRKREIERYLDQVGHATVSALAEKFEVSADTVRRDLEELRAEGSILRSHGGATSMKYQSGSDFPLMQRIEDNDERKQRVAIRAASLIEDGMTVLLNGGSTVLAMLPYLSARRGLTVVTNNLLVPQQVPEAALRSLYVVGGAVRQMSQVTVGPLVFPASEQTGASHRIAADIAFIAVGGVSVDSGFTTSDLSEARMMRELMAAAGRVVVLADGSKIGVRRFAQIAPLDAAQTLVTDDRVPPDLAQALDDAGVDVLVG